MISTILWKFRRKHKFVAKCCSVALIVSIITGCQPKEITSAKIYIQNNNWEKAIEQLEHAVDLHPNNEEAHFLLGQAYGNRSRYKDMNREFEISLMISDKFLQPITAERERHWIDKYNAGISALNQQEFSKAEERLKAAITIDPSKFEAYKKLAITFLNVDKVDKALILYNKLLEKSPEDLDLLASVANLYYSQKQFEKVIPILKKVLELEPNHRDALANLALAYDSLGKTEDAYKAFRKAIEANPRDKDLIFLFGVHHYNGKKFEEAIQLFEQVLTLDPNDFESISNIGNAYLSIAEDLRLKLRNTSNGSFTSLDIQKLKSQAILNYKNAIPYLKKSLEMQPNYPALWRNLGVAYVNTGEREKGEQAFLKSEELKVKSSSK